MKEGAQEMLSKVLVNIFKLNQIETWSLEKSPQSSVHSLLFLWVPGELSLLSPCRKAAVQGGRSSTGTVPGEMRTGCFSSPTIMNIGFNSSWHCWSLHYSFQWPSGCQNLFTAQWSTWPIVNHQRHTQTCSPLWIETHWLNWPRGLCSEQNKKV